ncbi:MAG TPA: hypothetical protein VHO06_04430 [Polyangia bacterium]|nr:hypothetical protein [Polyangia bacterium]
MNANDAKRDFDQSIEHVIASYRFFLQAIPTEAMFASGSVHVGQFSFSRYSQAEAMVVELGWAFFIRLEGCLEALVHRLGIKGADVPGKITAAGELSADELRGYQAARDLRNIYHHGDGDWTLLSKVPTEVRPAADSEPHLLPEHLERFYALFKKIAQSLTRPHLHAV